MPRAGDLQDRRADAAGRAADQQGLPGPHADLADDAQGHTALRLFLKRGYDAEGSAPVRRMIEESPALREYEESMSLRHAQAPAETLAADPHLSRSSTACKATADDPGATVDEVFRMIEAAWEATAP